jgi:hypothetical protein
MVGHYSKTAKELVADFLSARFPETASLREIMSGGITRKVAEISVKDALLRLEIENQVELTDQTPRYQRDWRWRALR